MLLKETLVISNRINRIVTKLIKIKRCVCIDTDFEFDRASVICDQIDELIE